MPFDAPPPPAPLSREAADRRAISRWLLALAGMVWAMVALGGATRLTGSGLSIMEWAPLSGTLPPLSDAEWRRLYGLYQHHPAVRSWSTRASGWKASSSIFWLEWVPPPLGPADRPGLCLLPLAVVLGCAGASRPGSSRGWCCCSWCSGRAAGRGRLVHGRLGVRGGPDRGLALSAGDASGARAHAVLWRAAVDRAGTAAAPEASGAGATAAPLRRLAHPTAGLVLLAILAGGFVAGIKAGLDYNTFPLMDGRLVPSGYAMLTPFWHNWTSNIAAVQFNHRLLATLAGIAALTLAAWGAATLPASRARMAVLALGGTVALQYTLGIATLLLVVPAWLGTLHQAVAVAVLTAVLATLHALRRPRAS
jgi:cytochrome c oxidase assembly protein subunit 15